MKQSQKLLLTWLIEDNSLFDRIKGRISADDFTEELYHKVAKEVFFTVRDHTYSKSGQDSKHVYR